MDIESLKPFVESLCEKSAEIINPYFFGKDYDLEQKDNDTPVTRADKEAELCIRELIQNNFPDHGILGEEFGSINENAEYTWVIDPIDGTKGFITGCPLFTTLVGLLHNGKPVLGAIHQPTTGLLCIGDNDTCTLNGKAVSCSNPSSIKEATVLATSSASVSQYQDEAKFNALAKRAKLFRTWGDGYGYLLVACGKADAMIDPIVNPWDVLPVIPVIRGAGATITNYQGNTGNWGSSVAAAPSIHPLVIKGLN